MTTQQQARKARFKEVIQHLDIDRQILASNLGYKKKYLDQILSADKNLSDSVALKFTKRYKQVNEDWLFTGSGEMLNDEVGDTYQLGKTKTEVSETEPEYTGDPLAGLRALIARVESLERWRAEVEGK